MTQWNSLNVKLSNSELNKWKSGIENKTKIVLRLSSNIIGNSNYEINFPHELLLTNRRVAKLRKAFANNSSTDINLSKIQLFKMIKSGGFLGRLFGPLLKTGLPLTKKSLAKSHYLLAKSVLILLGLTAATSSADASIHKKNLGIWNNNTSNIK